jgi:ATP-binding cassette subfamily B protein
MNKQKQPKPRIWSNIHYLFMLAFKLDPGRVALQFFRQAINYGTWIFFGVIFLRYLLQSIQANVPISSIFTWIGISLAIIGLFSIVISWYDAKYRPLSDIRMSAALSKRLFTQAVRVDLACYEDEEFFNRYTLALQETENRLPEFLKQLAGSVTASMAAAVVITTLVRIDPWMLCYSSRLSAILFLEVGGISSDSDVILTVLSRAVALPTSIAFFIYLTTLRKSGFHE